MNIFEKLLKIQLEVRATKDLKNDFGNFDYRNAEMIYESLKPVCGKYNAVLRITDEIVEIGGKPYIKSIAELIDTEKSNPPAEGEVISIASQAFARIPDSKRGMDDSQLCGSASSYAHKFCVSALMLLDNNKDADVPPALPESREEFERYANNVYNQREKEAAMAENQKRLDEQENWRLMNGNQIEIKYKNGTWKNLDDMELKHLEMALFDERFKDITHFIQLRIDKKKGVVK